MELAIIKGNFWEFEIIVNFEGWFDFNFSRFGSKRVHEAENFFNGSLKFILHFR